MTSQASVCVGGSIQDVLPCVVGDATEILVLTQEAEAAAAAMSVAMEPDKNAAVLHYKQAMRRLVRYLAANNATENQAGFFRR